MRQLRLPNWIRRHMPWYEPGLRTAAEWEGLRLRLAKLSHPQPAVSIVMPVYNEAESLAATLSSMGDLLLSDVFGVELIVVNDGSTDHTQEILDRLGVKTISWAENKGRKHARQAGLEAAGGQYLLQADADTLYPPSWGLLYVRALADPEIAVVYGPHAFLPGPGMPRPALLLHELMGDTMRWIKRKRTSHTYINVHGFNSGFRRQDALEKGSYDFEPGGSEDGHMARLLNQHGKIAYLNDNGCTAYTSSRRLAADGGLIRAILKRMRRDLGRLLRYLRT